MVNILRKVTKYHDVKIVILRNKCAGSIIFNKIFETGRRLRPCSGDLNEGMERCNGS